MVGTLDDAAASYTHTHVWWTPRTHPTHALRYNVFTRDRTTWFVGCPERAGCYHARALRKHWA